jgi:SAM-dependent methyltransferase
VLPLDANWMRAASRSLRLRQPRLYATLNGVRNRILSRATGLSGYQAKAVSRFDALLPRPRARLRLLEIGSDRDGKVLSSLARTGVAEAIGINPDPGMWEALGGGERRLSEGALLRRGDASAMPFEDTSFDAIFSVATFEHVLDLPRALAEMHRVLRPGGFVFSLFGPIWSGCRGHHLRVDLPGAQYRHFVPEANPLPDFCHLLLGRDELRAALRERVAGEAIEPIVAWVFDGDGINRLFFQDYLDLFAASAFSREALRLETDPVDESLARLLCFRHPQESRFDVTNAEVVLRKAGARGS